MICAGRILTILTFFMLLDIMKIFKPAQVIEANARLAYPVSALTGIGMALIACRLRRRVKFTELPVRILGAGRFTQPTSFPARRCTAGEEIGRSRGIGRSLHRKAFRNSVTNLPRKDRLSRVMK